MRRSRSYGYGDDIAGLFASGAVILAIIAAFLVLYIVVKGINMICRALAAPQGRRLVIVLLLGTCFFGLLALATKAVIAVGLCVVFFLVFLLTCRCVDLYNTNTLQKQGKLIETVLKPKQWWQPVTPDAALAASAA